MLRKIRAFAGGLLHRARSAVALSDVLRTGVREHSLQHWDRSLIDPTGYYLDCVRFFHSGEFSSALKRHRAYFRKEQRGFGEDAFHVMWWLIFRELRPAHFLEIGVYRGQTLSLASLLQRELGVEGSVVGISPFTASGDTVSQYRDDLDYLADTKTHFDHFGLPGPELLRSRSTDPAARERIQLASWDAIYIDGNHDYDVAKSDWEICSASTRTGGIIVLDDSAVGTSYRPPVFATAGHSGPSRIAREIDRRRFREILRVGHNRVFQQT